MIILSNKPRQARSSVNIPATLYYFSALTDEQSITFAYGWRLPTDLFETEDAFIVRVEVAGMNEEDFELYADTEHLSIRGVRNDQTPQNERAFHQMEIRFGEFRIDIELPAPINAAEAQADYQNGFLKIHLPKHKPQRIHIIEE